MKNVYEVYQDDNGNSPVGDPIYIQASCEKDALELAARAFKYKGAGPLLTAFHVTEIGPVHTYGALAEEANKGLSAHRVLRILAGGRRINRLRGQE